ncbi:hypothetical protein PQR75_20655 [Paraburkholderia fungorum]|uniref:hypothetical protein n=1 Tax=Paraburkholderia fungorum TaxID=134537 RepID=UPI0038BD2957
MIDEADGIDELLVLVTLLVGDIGVDMLSLCLLKRRIAPALRRKWRCVSEAAGIRCLCVGF